MTRMLWGLSPVDDPLAVSVADGIGHLPERSSRWSVVSLWRLSPGYWSNRTAFGSR